MILQFPHFALRNPHVSPNYQSGSRFRTNPLVAINLRTSTHPIQSKFPTNSHFLVILVFWPRLQILRHFGVFVYFLSRHCGFYHLSYLVDFVISLRIIWYTALMLCSRSQVTPAYAPVSRTCMSHVSRWHAVYRSIEETLWSSM